MPYRRGISLPSFSLSAFLPGGKEGTQGWLNYECAASEGISLVLEISSKSPDTLGILPSAFTLKDINENIFGNLIGY